MADLLRAGYTMLNLSCPICKNPIFQNKNGYMFCPICNREVVIVDKQESLTKTQSLNQSTHKNLINNSKTFENIGTFDELKQIILDKISFITNKFNDENQIEKVEKYTNVLIKLFKLLNYITKKIYKTK